MSEKTAMFKKQVMLDKDINSKKPDKSDKDLSSRNVPSSNQEVDKQACKQACQEYCEHWKDRNCNPYQHIQMLALALIILMMWLILYAIFTEEFSPTSEPFQLLVLFCTAKLLGMLVEVVHIPAVVGMILMGVILKNVGYLKFSRSYIKVNSILRKASLLSILLPAAFSLDPAILGRMCLLLIFVSILPVLVEIFVDCVLSYFALSLPWLWALLLGIIMAAAAPAIVIPCLFTLEEMGFGNGEGVHTVASASCILITIICIIMFGLVYGFVIARSKEEMLKNLYKGPMEIGIGLVYGFGLGFIAWFIPDDMDFYVTTIRTMYIVCGTLLALFGGLLFTLDFAGTIGTFTHAFIANLRWRRLGWERYNPVRDNFKLVWRFMEPVAFSLIGMEMDFKTLRLNDLLIGTLIMLIGIVVRFCFTLFLIYRFGFSKKNTIFIALTYISKATVQAAIGPLAIDWARTENVTDVVMQKAECLLTVTVSSIVLTSPLGVVLLFTLGPRLLDRQIEPSGLLRRVGMSFSSKPDHAVRSLSKQMAQTLKK